jgi:hypothetical protein
MSIVGGKSVNEYEIVFGFITGILILGALFVWILTEVIWVIPLAIFVMGMITLLDTLFPYGRQPYIYTFVGGFTVGCFAVLFTNAYGFLYWIIAAAVLSFVLHIASKILKRISR